MIDFKEKSKQAIPYRTKVLRNRKRQTNYNKILSATDFDEMFGIIEQTSKELDEIVRFISNSEITLQALNLYSMKNNFIKEYKKTRNPVFVFKIFALCEYLVFEYEKELKKRRGLYWGLHFKYILKLDDLVYDLSHNIYKYYENQIIHEDGKLIQIIEVLENNDFINNYAMTRKYLTKGILSKIDYKNSLNLN